MRIGALLRLMKIRLKPKRRFQAAKGSFYPGQHHIGLPDLFVIEIHPIRVKNITALESLMLTGAIFLLPDDVFALSNFNETACFSGMTSTSWSLDALGYLDTFPEAFQSST